MNKKLWVFGVAMLVLTSPFILAGALAHLAFVALEKGWFVMEHALKVIDKKLGD